MIPGPRDWPGRDHPQPIAYLGPDEFVGAVPKAGNRRGRRALAQRRAGATPLVRGGTVLDRFTQLHRVREWRPFELTRLDRKIITSIITSGDARSPHLLLACDQGTATTTENHERDVGPARPIVEARAQRYEIRLQGHLGARWAEWFDGLSLSNESDGTTLISGLVADQAALHGLLQKVRDLGVPLVSVTQADLTTSTTKEKRHDRHWTERQERSESRWTQ